MCHNSSNVQSEQIEKLVDHGMPRKIIKTIQYTIKKRNKEAQQLEDMKQASQIITTTTDNTFARKHSIVSQEIQDITSNGINTMEGVNHIKIPKLCGRFRQMQQMSAGMDTNAAKPYTDDVLAVGTQMTRALFVKINCAIDDFKCSKTYTLLTTTTQLAHVVAVGVLAFVLIAIWPNLMQNNKQIENDSITSLHSRSTRQRASANGNPLAAIAYLAAFAMHFGAQIWMTFVSGLSLYFALPRHTFGQTQKVLFPRYFAFNAALSVLILVLFVKYFHGNWQSKMIVQLIALVLIAVIQVVIRLYLADPLLRLMHEKYKIEAAAGIGREVGNLLQSRDLLQCPHYVRIHKAFRRLHMIVAMGNMTVLVASCLHLYYLASKLQIQ